MGHKAPQFLAIMIHSFLDGLTIVCIGVGEYRLQYGIYTRIHSIHIIYLYCINTNQDPAFFYAIPAILSDTNLPFVPLSKFFWNRINSFSKIRINSNLVKPFCKTLLEKKLGFVSLCLHFSTLDHNKHLAFFLFFYSFRIAISDFHSFVIFCLPYLFSFVWCSIREWWRGSLFQLPFVGISWIHLCLRSSNPSLCFFKIMGSIDCTWMWYGWLFVHWTSGMEKKQTAIIWMRKKKKIRKKCPFLTNRNLIYLLFLQWKKWNTKT